MYVIITRHHIGRGQVSLGFLAYGPFLSRDRALSELTKLRKMQQAQYGDESARLEAQSVKVSELD